MSILRNPPINTHEQLLLWEQAGLTVRPVAICKRFLPGRDSSQSGWYVYSPWERTARTPTAWYEYGNQSFYFFGMGGGTRAENKKLALENAILWVRTIYGIDCLWAANRAGDYVPKRLNDKFKLRKT